MRELESGIMNPFKCQALIDLSVDHAGDGVGDQGSIIGVTLICPIDCPLKFKEETRFVRDNSGVDSALEDLKSIIARQIDIRCVPLQTARATGNLTEFLPPDKLN